MKKFLIILGTIFLLIIVLIGVVIGFLLIEGPVLDKESKTFADASLSAIFSDWDEQAFLDRTSPECVRANPKEELNKYFLGMSRKFGQIHSCEGCVGESNVNANGWVITAQYTARVVFDGGPAKITLSLIKHGNKWEIYSVNVSSAALLPH
jgi:hypothetical protein